MSYVRRKSFVPEAPWARLNTATLELVFTATLLLSSVSLVAMSLGEPETMALIAGTGIAVVLLGLAAVSLFDTLETVRD